MDERKILKEISRILGVQEDEIPKTLRRFKKDLGA
jgi:DNA-directed RNA polymerase delta subunit